MLIYDESSNVDYSVSVETSLSKELILLKVKTLLEPYTNEIWVRSANYDLDQSALGKRNKFWLVQPMQGRGIRYHVKHSGEFLYKLSNEDDFDRFKITKIRMPHEIKEPRKRIEASKVPSAGEDGENSKLQVNYDPNASLRLGKKNEIAPTSAYLTDRESYLLPQTSDEAHPLTGLREQTTIFEAEVDEHVLQFEVFKNYLALIVEKNG